MEEQPKGKPMRLNIEVPQELEAIYANLAVIRHSASEIVIDFIRQMPEQSRAKVYTRVVLTPMNAKLLLRALNQNLETYEGKFGEIRTPQQGFQEDKGFGFTR